MSEEYTKGLEQAVSFLAKAYEDITDIVRDADIDLYCRLPVIQGTSNIIALAHVAKLDMGNDKIYYALDTLRKARWQEITATATETNA